MRANEFILEGPVVQGNFGQGSEVPGMPVPKGYDSFQTKQISDKGATQIIGIKGNKQTVVSTVTSAEAAQAIAKYYNSGKSNEITPMSMSQAFGSEEYNIIKDAGFKFKEKPSYFSDLWRDPISELDLRKIKNQLEKAGYRLQIYSDEVIFGGALDEDEDSPQQKTTWTPQEDVFMIDMELTGNRYLVDQKGASSYIRFWMGMQL